jgi:hypothetical protein
LECKSLEGKYLRYKYAFPAVIREVLDKVENVAVWKQDAAWRDFTEILNVRNCTKVYQGT